MFAELEQLNETWNRAWLEKDAAVVERLMADDYVYIAPNGQRLERQAILDIIRSESYRLSHGTRSEITAKAIGADTAVVMHRWQGEGAFEGNTFKDDHRCTMLCARRDGAWQIVLEHCSFNQS
jgi:uncharacterized protein (TIGR02246 family)